MEISKDNKLGNPTISYFVNFLRSRFVSKVDQKSWLNLHYTCFSFFAKKIDHSFFTHQFSIDCKMHLKDQNCFGWGLLFYVNENVPCRALTKVSVDSNFDIIFFK